jgi:hypothetical protein
MPQRMLLVLRRALPQRMLFLLLSNVLKTWSPS